MVVKVLMVCCGTDSVLVAAVVVVMSGGGGSDWKMGEVGGGDDSGSHSGAGWH